MNNYQKYKKEIVDYFYTLEDYLSKEECIEKYHLELEELKEVKTKRNSLFRKRK